MNARKLLNIVISLVIIAANLLGSSPAVKAMPMDPTDEETVPHYFGPNPNWALSPLRQADVAVDLTGGGGTGATAQATVDPQTGVITAITVTSPGSGYTSAPLVSITGLGIDGAATAVVDYSGVVTAITVDVAGGGYTAPVATISGGGATTDATAIVYGGVDAVAVTDPGLGYTFPTVEFGLPDGPGGLQATGHADMDANGSITAVTVDSAGSGYSVAPVVTIHNGTVDTPDPFLPGGFAAVASSTLAVQSVALDTFGSGYTSAPSVLIADSLGAGNGALATAIITTSGGSVTSISIDNPGSGYMTPGIKKFVDGLPGLCNPAELNSCPDFVFEPTAKYIPLAVPELKMYNGVEAEEYVIGLVQYRNYFSSAMPNGALVRGYVQLETPDNAGISQHYPLTNEMIDDRIVDTGYFGVTPPQYLGPIIIASKNKAVRIVFRNLLPTGSDGDLFLPTDSSLMGAGMGPMPMADPMDEGTVLDMVRNPMCSESPKPDSCFSDNRATLHLHGGISPWISDGTAHQWITPAGETTDWPQGVSVANVPDMDVCTGDRDGCSTFYYTNQQSARLMFYHDHLWGATRLQVYAGAAAGYLITDETEAKLFGSTGLFPDLGTGIPLIVQDKTFVPADSQMYNVLNPDGSVKSYGQDPTWDAARWGGPDSLWYHHVYMPAQNPGDPSGMSAYGRWMYGPWFWPPATPPHGPIANPYYDAACKLDDPATWQYQTDPFCEPELIPGTPLISVGMEQFNDTPLVNGVAYPTTLVEPKSYRFRMLNAANDRFFNFQWYIADPTTGTDSEVALNPLELATAQTDPNTSPTPVQSAATAGPDWIQIGSEGGFLPAPVVVDGQQFTTWITDPTRFDVGNVDLHSLLLAPAERADVIVDFSQFAGQTLILYNDAPAAFPARVPSYDYYTGAPDMSPNGAAAIVPGYGPNTRTVMQVKVAANPPAPAFDLAKLEAAFTHKADGSGVFEEGQHPIIVGQAAYNSAYGTNFASGANCNAPNSTSQTCDGFVRVNDHTTFGFNTLMGPTTKMSLHVEPKAIHDEMNSTTFDEFGRMTANLGVEAQPPLAGLQNVTLYPFVNPPTELIDGTNLPKQDVTYDVTTGLPVSDVKITPISDAADGSQIWRITHNGVDTHPIHFHLYDVQVVNRVTWDNIIIPTDPAELGWKDTVRISPLQDTIVALRPIIPEVPFELPNAIRPLNPMMPLGSTAMFNNFDVHGNPTNPVVNQLVNFGWEYTYHCHILSHEEMDMMRPVVLALPPIAPDGLVGVSTGSGSGRRLVLSWNDNSINETSFVVQRFNVDGTWTDVGVVLSPLGSPNVHEVRSFTVPGTYNPDFGYKYRVVAKNTVGYGAEYPSMTVQSMSGELAVGTAPLAPTDLTVALQAGPQVRLAWRDNAINETGFVIERSIDGINFSFLALAPARNNTGNATYTDTTIALQTLPATYTYRVAAVNPVGSSAYTVPAAIFVTQVVVPAAPTSMTAVLQTGPQVALTWKDNADNETGFIIERSTDGGAFSTIGTFAASAGTGNIVATVDATIMPTFTDVTYAYRVAATNPGGTSTFSNTSVVTVPALPLAPSNLLAVNGPNKNKARSVVLVWSDNSGNETSFTIQRATNALFTQGLTSTIVGANVTTLTQTGLTRNTQYWYRIRANNGSFIFTNWVNATPYPITTNP
ncbi:MAG TPA: multicopper oxidase domain-containing protein [Bellilinea sp.]|nr:multicopper oxidase domain-containing protein [Bellilinea sp.]